MVGSELDKKIINADSGNYGHKLGMFMKQNGLVESKTESLGESAKAADKPSFAPGKNIISKTAGLLDEEGIRKLSGWNGKFKGSTLKSCLELLSQFQESMEQSVSADDISAMGTAETCFFKLTRQVQYFVRVASQKMGVLHKKEAAAVLPAMSSLLIQLYALGNSFDNSENLAYDYLLEGNLSSATVGEIMTGQSSKSLQGNMIDLRNSSPTADKTAKQLHEWTDKKEINIDYKQQLNSRRLPGLGEKGASQALQRILTMLDDIELQTEDSIEREDIRTQYFDVTKMILLLLQHPQLLEADGASKIKKGKNIHEYEDLINTAEFFKAVAGKTVGEALERIDEIRQSKAETAAADSISKGGSLSQALIDKNKKRVLRATKENAGVKVQKSRNNYNYDEAMSKLGEVTGLGGQAGARTTYYKDLEGKLQYGTNMDLAAGKQGTDAKLSFGDSTVDSQMKAGRHNIFGHSTPKELEKNAGLIISSFKMQITDYLSQHSDRHFENFFIDLEAENPENAFMGIDNDNVFGYDIASERAKRTLSYEKHAKDKTGNAEYRGHKDLTATLSGFRCIPKETVAQVEALDEKKIGEAMIPYLDRGARFALIKRVAKLKEYVRSEAKVVDIHTPEGMEEFKTETLDMIVNSFMKLNIGHKIIGGSDNGSFARMIPAIMARTLAMQYFVPGNKSVENDYITDGTEVKDYYAAGNKKVRAQKFWNSFEGMVRAAGLEESKEFKDLKERFKSGKEVVF